MSSGVMRNGIFWCYVKMMIAFFFALVAANISYRYISSWLPISSRMISFSDMTMVRVIR